MAQLTVENLVLDEDRAALIRSEAGHRAGINEVVAFLDQRATNENVMEFAGALAQEHGARLIGVFVQPVPEARPAEMFARGPGIRDVLEAYGAQLRHIEAVHQTMFENVARRKGLASEWRVLSHFHVEASSQARYGDLTVVARRTRGEEPSAASGLVESLVMSSGRPTLVLPPDWTTTKVRRILVGWNAGREATRAVADALPLLIRAEAVEVLIVEHGRQGGGHGQEPGADIARHLARHGAKVEVRRVGCGGEDVGRVLLARAAGFAADLVVIGAYGHSQLREWALGGVTRTLLREATIPILLSR